MAILKKYKSKTFKKQKQKKKQAYQKLRELIRNFTIEQWLLLIRTIDSQNQASIENHQYKGEFLVLVADMTLRLSRSNPKMEYPRPSSDDLKKIISLYFEIDQAPSKLIKSLGMASLPLIAAWQNRFHYPPLNILGRMHLLYEDYQDDILEIIGITTTDMHAIVLVLHSVYLDKEFMYFTWEALYSPKVGSLSQENIEKFLDFFAIDIDAYHSMARSLKVYDNQVGKFNLMNRYPIIKLEDNRYIIPSDAQFIDSVAGNLYHHILAHKQSIGKKISGAYLTQFGTTLENYVVDLAKYTFGKENIVDANTIVTEAEEDRCEVVCYNEKNALAIEVKKLHFRRDAIANADAGYIEEAFDRSLIKGTNQVASTLRYVKADTKYGLVVIPDTMLSPSAVLDYIGQSDSSIDIKDNNILICTLSTYESLMANSCETIFDTLDIAKGRSAAEGNDISLILGDMKKEGKIATLNNPYLEEIFITNIKEQELMLSPP